MSTEPEKTDDGRCTKERLQADLKNLQAQLQQAEQNVNAASQAVEQWRGKCNALIGAVSYCQELLKGYGVEATPPTDTKPVEQPPVSKSQRRRKNIQHGLPQETGLTNGKTSGPADRQVD